MPRRPRVFVDGAVYHVYCRFARGVKALAAVADAEDFLEVLRAVKKRDGLVILAWCLMPTHYHLAVRTGTVPLWRTLRVLQGRFAMRFNRRHRALGPLWQSRYKAKLVSDDRYFRRLLAYIHLNPVKANAVEDPKTSVWSGHRELLGTGRNPICDRDETLRLFGATRREAVSKYRSTVRALAGETWAEREPGRLPWWGSPAARDDDDLGEPAAGPRVDALGASSGRARPALAAADLIRRACTTLGVEFERLRSLRRDAEIVRARETIAVVAVERYGVRVNAIAGLCGKPPDTVSRWVSRGAARRSADDGFRRSVEALDAALAESAPSAPRSGRRS